MDLDAGNPRPEYWSFYASDGAELRFADIGDEDAPPLILLHGFTGSSKVWKRNWSALSTVFRVITPDLRGHGPYANADLKRTPNSSGYHVSRLAMDLKTLIDSLGLAEGKIMCIAGSLGCAVLWSGPLSPSNQLTVLMRCAGRLLNSSRRLLFLTWSGWISHHCRTMNQMVLGALITAIGPATLPLLWHSFVLPSNINQMMLLKAPSLRALPTDPIQGLQITSLPRLLQKMRISS